MSGCSYMTLAQMARGEKDNKSLRSQQLRKEAAGQRAVAANPGSADWLAEGISATRYGELVKCGAITDLRRKPARPVKQVSLWQACHG